jgi:hypothetical protein
MRAGEVVIADMSRLAKTRRLPIDNTTSHPNVDAVDVPCRQKTGLTEKGSQKEKAKITDT